MNPQGPPLDFSKSPVSVSVEARTYEKDDPNFQTRDNNGNLVHANPGVTVRQFWAQVGGDEGYVVDPVKGDRHFVSIKGQPVSSPDTTMVSIRWKIVPLVKGTRPF